MNVLIGVVIGGVLLALLEGRHQSITATISADGSIVPRLQPPQLIPQQVMVGSTAVDGAALGIGIQGAEMGLESVKSIASAVPIVGSIIGAIGGALLAAHAQRAHEATDENSAVTKAVAQVDQTIAAAFNNLNDRKITPAQAKGLLNQAWAWYWSIIGTHIQPDRNGCKNGAANIPISGGPTLNPDTYHGCPPKAFADWGAACCIGSAIKASLANCIWAVDHPRQSAPVVTLYGSKYGFPGRAGYRVVYQP
jgi:hypothetical protein